MNKSFVRVGPYELSSNLFLSPLAGYTNLPMRLTVRELGGLAWTTTDLVNARSLIERNPTALKQLIGAKTKLLPFSKEILDASFKASLQVYEENGAKSPEWKKIYADFLTFQRDQVAWFRVAEGRFDNYMQSVKL